MITEIPVVAEADAKDEAESMGREALEKADPVQFDFENFTQTDIYASNVLPKLRCLAGYGDTGVGTWQVERDVAVLPVGTEDDLPAEAEVVRSSEFVEELVDAWREGANSVFEGGDN